MDSLLNELSSFTKRKPSRLLAVGLPGSEALQAEKATRCLDALPQNLNGDDPFDLVIWRLEGPCRESELARIPALMAERSRLILALDAGHRRESILNLSRRGFAVHDERRLDDSAWHLIVARPTDFEVRAFQEGDEQDILRMFKPSFHVERSLDHWRWKFEGNPFGSRLITIARHHDGTLAAHYAGYPVLFSRFGKKRFGRAPSEQQYLALQIGDTMTLPQFRSVGRGPTSLLGRCVRHFFATYCEDRIDFNFGFNTGNIQKFSRRFVNASQVENVGYWIRPVGIPAGDTHSYRISTPRAFDRSWDRFFQRVGPHYGLMVRRDSAWLNWRYAQHPDEPPFLVFAAHKWGRLVAWTVFRRHENRLKWCDALFDPRHLEAAWPMLQTAMEHPAMDGVESIEAWFPSRPEWWRRQLIALGFEPAQEPNDLALMTVPFQQAEAEELLKGLYYTMGDGDLA